MGTREKVVSFTFTPGQLRKLLIEAIGLNDEYIHAHGLDAELAPGQAAADTLDGLQEAQWLIDQGELEANSGQVYPGTVCPKCYADWVQSGVENF